MSKRNLRYASSEHKKVSVFWHFAKSFFVTFIKWCMVGTFAAWSFGDIVERTGRFPLIVTFLFALFGFWWLADKLVDRVVRIVEEWIANWSR